ncbi:MAG: methyltransferase domain-containing protein [Patescibacteria group bacterium]
MKNFEREPSIIEKTNEEVFQDYIEDLRLEPDDFGKKILDVGAGAAQFAKWAKEHRVSTEIYSLEPRKENLTGKDKSVVAQAEAIPFADESFDLVVSNAAIPNVYTGEGNGDTAKEKVMNSLAEMVRVIRPGGEIRLARVLRRKESKLQRPSQSVDEALENLKAGGNIQIEEIRTPEADVYEYNENHDPVTLTAEAYLIIIRKRG